jgi:hypothetical protein
MSTAIQTFQEPQYIKDEKGNYTYAILPIERYSHLIKIEEIYNGEEYIPNEETKRAIEEGLKEKEAGILKGYTDIRQMFDDILEDNE